MISLTLISLGHDDLVRLAGPQQAMPGAALLSRRLALAAAGLAAIAALAMVAGHA